MKIERLTPEQEAELPLFREEWLKVGLSTKKVDRDASTSAVKRLYRAGGQDEPLVMHFDSPAQCLLAIGLFESWGDLPKETVRANLGVNLGVKLRDNLGVNLRDNLGANLWDNLWDNLQANLWANLGVNLGANLGANLRDNLRANLGANLRDNLRDNLWANLRANLQANLRDNLWANLGANLGDNGLYRSTYFWGGIDAYWLAWAQFAERIGVPIEKKEHFDAYIEYAKTSGVGYFYRGLAFVSDRPELILKDSETRLHAETGPAVLFRDGYAVHCWHGTNVPAHWIEDTANVDPAEVLQIENVELRAAGVAIIGVPRMSEKLDRKIIDGDPDSDIGALIELTLPGLDEPGRYLWAQCPRNGTICEGVPRRSDIDGKEINTAIAAQAWRDFLPQDEYIHPPIRT